MTEKLSEKITEYLQPDEKEKEVVMYGVQQLLVIVLHLFTVAIVGCLWKEIWFSFCYFIAFLLVRPYVGGYHADSRGRCYGIFVCSFCVILFLKSCFTLPLFLYTGIMIVCGSVIYRLAPVENPAKRLDEMEFFYYRRKGRIFLLIFFMLGLLGVFLKLNYYTALYAILCCLSAVCL